MKNYTMFEAVENLLKMHKIAKKMMTDYKYLNT